MTRRTLLAGAAVPFVHAAGGRRALIVADEFPAMEVLATRLKAGAGVESRIVAQTGMPAGLAEFDTVIVYIHRGIGEPAEKAFIEYANAGGRLLLLHHSISSGKRKNRWWLPFLKISLPAKPFEEGGYKYYEDITLDIVNLAPGEPVSSNGVAYPAAVTFEGAARPGFRLLGTEVYLNHEFLAPRTHLLGFRFEDVKTGKTFEQKSAGWYMRAGRGLVMYFMPGHSVRDFENPSYGQILVNAAAFRP